MEVYIQLLWRSRAKNVSYKITKSLVILKTKRRLYRFISIYLFYDEFLAVIFFQQKLTGFNVNRGLCRVTSGFSLAMGRVLYNASCSSTLIAVGHNILPVKAQREMVGGLKGRKTPFRLPLLAFTISCGIFALETAV